jgi:hypothetical protein
MCASDYAGPEDTLDDYDSQYLAVSKPGAFGEPGPTCTNPKCMGETVWQADGWAWCPECENEWQVAA